jgi:hypothetical protein
MRIRIAIVVGLFVALLSTAGSAQAVLRSRTTATGDWGCIGIRPANQGLCFENPLPERLPLPERPADAS